MEFTEYSVLDLNWTDKNAEAKNTQLSRRRQVQRLLQG